MILEYLDKVKELLDKIVDSQEGLMSRAARLISDALENQGMIYVFGTGHSHLIAEEGFFRAGGLARVCPILTTELMLHDGAVKTSTYEKIEELAHEILLRYAIKENDIFLVFSNSGINALPVEVARLVKLQNIKVISVCADAYLEEESNHSSKKYLKDYSDVHLNTFAPLGDAVLSPMDKPPKMGAVSTITGCFILNALLLEAAHLAYSNGYVPEIYTCRNLEGGRENNAPLIEKYREIIPHI